MWKTDDAGRTWRPIFDDQPTQSIGAIAVAPSDPNIIYAGSGEGLHRPDLSGDVFGTRVALAADGRALTVAAPSEDSTATGINGNQGNNAASSAGAAYVFP